MLVNLGRIDEGAHAVAVAQPGKIAQRLKSPTAAAAIRADNTQVNGMIMFSGGPNMAECEPHLRRSGTYCLDHGGPEADKLHVSRPTCTSGSVALLGAARASVILGVVQDFDKAGRRHYSDAEYLHKAGRLPNADHLAGVAAECVLKALLVRYLGATSTPKKPYSVSATGQKIEHGHLPGLWQQFLTVLSGRSARLMALMSNNPFQGWSIEDRYADGSSVTASVVETRLRYARAINSYLQTSKILGGLH